MYHIKDGKIVSEFNADDLKHASMKQYRIVFKTHEEYQRFKDSFDRSVVTVIKDDGVRNKLLIAADDKYINQVISFLLYSICSLPNRMLYTSTPNRTPFLQKIW